jgi:hypothetical protein
MTQAFKDIMGLIQILGNEDSPYSKDNVLDLVFRIASEQVQLNEDLKQEGNTFHSLGRFLIDHAEGLEQQFDSDRRYGRLAVVPNVLYFIMAKFEVWRNL